MRNDSKPTYRLPLSDSLVEYTWRRRAKNIVGCPKCGLRGQVRYLETDECVIVHREVVSDFDYPCYQEACEVTPKEVEAALREKEDILNLNRLRYEKRKQALGKKDSNNA